MKQSNLRVRTLASVMTLLFTLGVAGAALAAPVQGTDSSRPGVTCDKDGKGDSKDGKKGKEGKKGKKGKKGKGKGKNGNGGGQGGR